MGRPAKNHPQQVRRDGARDDVDDRETPPEIFDTLHAKYGFTLDVAASRENAKASTYYDLEQNGLVQPWQGRVWCNPPYSNIRPWVEKAWNAISVGGARVVVMLLPSNRTEQKWWQELVEPWRDGKFERNGGVELSVRFIPGRPRFFRPSGKVGGPKGDRPPFGLCVLTWWSRCPSVLDCAPCRKGIPLSIRGYGPEGPVDFPVDGHVCGDRE